MSSAHIESQGSQLRNSSELLCLNSEILNRWASQASQANSQTAFSRLKKIEEAQVNNDILESSLKAQEVYSEAIKGLFVKSLEMGFHSYHDFMENFKAYFEDEASSMGAEITETLFENDKDAFLFKKGLDCDTVSTERFFLDFYSQNKYFESSPTFSRNCKAYLLKVEGGLNKIRAKNKELFLATLKLIRTLNNDEKCLIFIRSPIISECFEQEDLKLLPIISSHISHFKCPVVVEQLSVILDQADPNNDYHKLFFSTKQLFFQLILCPNFKKLEPFVAQCVDAEEYDPLREGVESIIFALEDSDTRRLRFLFKDVSPFMLHKLIPRNIFTYLPEANLNHSQFICDILKDLSPEILRKFVQVTGKDCMHEALKFVMFLSNRQFLKKLSYIINEEFGDSFRENELFDLLQKAPFSSDFEFINECFQKSRQSAFTFVLQKNLTHFRISIKEIYALANKRFDSLTNDELTLFFRSPYLVSDSIKESKDIKNHLDLLFKILSRDHFPREELESRQILSYFQLIVYGFKAEKDSNEFSTYWAKIFPLLPDKVCFNIDALIGFTQSLDKPHNFTALIEFLLSHSRSMDRETPLCPKEKTLIKQIPIEIGAAYIKKRGAESIYQELDFPEGYAALFEAGYLNLLQGEYATYLKVFQGYLHFYKGENKAEYLCLKILSSPFIETKVYRETLEFCLYRFLSSENITFPFNLKSWNKAKVIRFLIFIINAPGEDTFRVWDYLPSFGIKRNEILPLLAKHYPLKHLFLKGHFNKLKPSDPIYLYLKNNYLKKQLQDAPEFSLEYIKECEAPSYKVFRLCLSYLGKEELMIMSNNSAEYLINFPHLDFYEVHKNIVSFMEEENKMKFISSFASSSHLESLALYYCEVEDLASFSCLLNKAKKLEIKAGFNSKRRSLMKQVFELKGSYQELCLKKLSRDSFLITKNYIIHELEKAINRKDLACVSTIIKYMPEEALLNYLKEQQLDFSDYGILIRFISELQPKIFERYLLKRQVYHETSNLYYLTPLEYFARSKKWDFLFHILELCDTDKWQRIYLENIAYIYKYTSKDLTLKDKLFKVLNRCPAAYEEILESELAKANYDASKMLLTLNPDHYETSVVADVNTLPEPEEDLDRVHELFSDTAEMLRDISNILYDSNQGKYNYLILSADKLEKAAHEVQSEVNNLKKAFGIEAASLENWHIQAQKYLRFYIHYIKKKKPEDRIALLLEFKESIGHCASGKTQFLEADANRLIQEEHEQKDLSFTDRILNYLFKFRRGIVELYALRCVNASGIATVYEAHWRSTAMKQAQEAGYFPRDLNCFGDAYSSEPNESLKTATLLKRAYNLPIVVFAVQDFLSSETEIEKSKDNLKGIILSEEKEQENFLNYALSEIKESFDDKEFADNFAQYIRQCFMGNANAPIPFKIFEKIGPFIQYFLPLVSLKDLSLTEDEKLIFLREETKIILSKTGIYGKKANEILDSLEFKSNFLLKDLFNALKTSLEAAEFQSAYTNKLTEILNKELSKAVEDNPPVNLERHYPKYYLTNTGNNIFKDPRKVFEFQRLCIKFAFEISFPEYFREQYLDKDSEKLKLSLITEKLIEAKVLQKYNLD
jgi:hypothetical protein